MKSQLSQRFGILLAIVLAMSCCVSSYAVEVLTKEWTLAVFLNADNNLDPFGVEDMEEMSRIGSNEWLNIVSLIDRERGPASINYIEKDKITKVMEMGELDMGDYQELVRFMDYVQKNYPAKKYILTIWNHGSGWKLAGNKIFRGISYDDSSNNHITNAQLGIALKAIKKIIGHDIDILNMDACLMQMAEVIYVCKDTCRYVVASEETEPGKGTPYDDVFRTLQKVDSPLSFSKKWVKAFTSSYNGGSQGYEACTQSAIDCKAFEAVVDGVNGIAKAAMALEYRGVMLEIIKQVQKFSYPENIDLFHLTVLMKQLIKDEGVQTAATKLQIALKNAIIANGAVSTSMKDSYGLAIYLPWDFIVENSYANLAFAKNTLWDDMINDLKKRRSLYELATALEEGDTTKLRRFVAKSKKEDPELVRFVAQQLNYRIFSEKSVPASIAEEAGTLVRSLFQH